MSDYKIKIINPSEYRNWKDQILKFNHYSFFHTSEWSEVIEKSYGYKPAYFCTFREDEICSVLPAMQIESRITGKRLVSLPFSDFCEPLFTSLDDSEKLKEFIFDYCEQNNLKYMEFRTSETRFPFETEYFRTDLRHVLDISVGEPKLEKLLSQNTKRNIKSAIKEGLIVREENSSPAIENFYKLQCITRKKHGLPPQPESFFHNIYKYILSENKGTMFFAYTDNIPVALLMFFTIGDKVLYKFGASVTDKMPKGANHLLMWEAIKKYSAEGYKEFDFGRTETDHEGLRRFKLGFGADERIIYTTRFDIKTKSFLPPETKTTGFHNKVFNRLPVSILKLIGNSLYKHIG